MTLPEHIVKSALLGTARQPLDPAESKDDPILSLADRSPESRLLLSVARTALREKAGYIPEHSHLPLADPCHDEPGRVCSQEAGDFLRLILLGVHRYALNEWLIEASRGHLYAPEILMPKLLKLGQNRKELRPYLLPLVGRCGMWLALEINNQNWKWVFDSQTQDIDQLLAVERLREEELFAQLRDNKVTLQTWLQYRFPWSDNLMRAVLSYWETTITKSVSKSIRNLASNTLQPWINMAYFFPQSMRQVVQEQITIAIQTSKRPDTELQSFLERIDIVYNFREKMVAAIKSEGS